MERAQKEEIVRDLKGKLGNVTSVVLADFRGITVQTVTRVRDEFRAVGCEYHVLKNKLVGLAIKGTNLEPLTKMLKGPTAVIWHNEDPAAPAKVAAKWAKESQKFVVKGGFVDGQVLDARGVEALASMPGKDELRAKLLGLFLSAPQQLLALFIAAPTNFMNLLANKREQDSDAEKASPAA